MCGDKWIKEIKTHYSHVQNSFSRLDYMFVSKEGVEDVVTSKLQDILQLHSTKM